MDTAEWPQELRNAQEIVQFITDHTPDLDDFDPADVAKGRQRLLRKFQGYKAVLRRLQIAQVSAGDPDEHADYPDKERRYMRRDPKNMPPILVQNGKIVDGNHRYRVAVRKKLPSVLAYEVVRAAANAA